MNFSAYTSPGPWLHLYDDLPDELEPLMAVVKNLLLHPVDTHRYGIRIAPQREQVLRQILTVEQMLTDLFQTPPVSLVAERSPYQRLIKSCDFQAVLFASFGQFKGHEIRTRCGFAGYIAPGQWVHHWVNEVRRPFFDDWTFVDCDRRCLPPRETFRAGAEWWPLKNTPVVSRLKDYRFQSVNAVKHALLDDFNARNGQELIHYRWLDPRAPDPAPVIFQTAYTRLTSSQIKYLARIADALLADDDEQITALFCDEKYGAHLTQDAIT